jgi:hypothetical protein
MILPLNCLPARVTLAQQADSRLIRRRESKIQTDKHSSNIFLGAVPGLIQVNGRQISFRAARRYTLIWVPSSITRVGGRRKHSAALGLFFCIQRNSCG